MSNNHTCGGSLTNMKTHVDGNKAVITFICLKCQHKIERVYWASPIYHKEGNQCTKILTMQ